MRDLNQIYGTGLPRVETTISDKAIQVCVPQCADLMALRAQNAYLNAECDALKSDLATNAALLAKQHDRNMELETALLIKEKQLRMVTEALQNMVEIFDNAGTGFQDEVDKAKAALTPPRVLLSDLDSVCINRQCEFWIDDIDAQNCDGERNGEPSIVDCKKWNISNSKGK